MALILCQTCGKQVSDKARVCPGCGAILIEEIVEEREPTICQECGFEIPVGSDTCPNCGCPIETESEKSTESTPQKVELTSVNLSPISQKKKKIIIISIVAIALAIIGLLVGVRVSNIKRAEEAARIAEEAAAEYKSKLQTISFVMIEGGAKAETAGNLIKDVWYNAIYEKHNSSTDQYTISKIFNTDHFLDFNSALSNLFADSSFSEKISEIEANQLEVTELMKEMRDPPEGFEDAYSAIKECYDAYVSFTNMVTNPSGSLQTFSSNFNDADSEFLNRYNALKLYLD